jgi:hypothetical protein
MYLPQLARVTFNANDEETLRQLDPWGPRVPTYSTKADFDWYTANRNNPAFFDQEVSR